jgi:hypothetical protein
MEHVFPVVCFCIARQMLTTCMSTRKRACTECRFSARSRLNPLAMAIPAAGYTGQGRAPPRQGKSGFGIAVALVLADSLFGVARDSFPQISDFPRESPPIRQDRSRGTPSGAQPRENVDDT